MASSSVPLEQIDAYRWRIPQTGKMRVPGVVYASKGMIRSIAADESIQQVANVAQLPGIVKYSLAMPDVHSGYGFPIGGVAAFDLEEGVISPGGVGYDINCGCRLVTTGLKQEEIGDRIKELTTELHRVIPAGVGSIGYLRLSKQDIRKVLTRGALWSVEQGLGERADLERTESGGCLDGADPDTVSERALQRGFNQLGTLGSGNHFLEVGVVEEIFDEKAARAFDLFPGQVTVFIHSGSRGLGHQICDDYLQVMAKETKASRIELPDRQLACAPLKSDAARRYLAAMACAANYAWANRQALMHWTREVFMKTLNLSPRWLYMNLLYDVCHNVAKLETHTVEGKTQRLCVHRKGATRAFPPGHPEVPEPYREVGQPVLIPGDMGRASYILAGTEKAMEETFGSTCHGAGRLLSRTQAIKKAKGRAIARELEDRGIYVHAAGKHTMAEEMPEAYKDVNEVVEVAHGAGISRKVARLRPWGVVKG